MAQNLSFFSISNEGLGHCSFNEVKEILSDSSSNLIQHKDAVIFNLNSENISKVFKLYKHNQSMQSLSCFLSNFNFDCTEEKLTNLNIGSSLIKLLFDGSDSKELSYKVEIIGLKGNENRINLGRKLYPLIEKNFKENLNISTKLEFKQPDLIFQVYHTGVVDTNQFLFGLRLNKTDFDSRDYRLHAHQASFKGDFAYSLLKKTDLKNDDTVLVLFCKDSVLSIEAELFKQRKILREPTFEDYLSNIPLFSVMSNESNEGCSFRSSPKPEIKPTLSFDENFANIRASRTNSKIAGVLNEITILKCPLSDLTEKIPGQSIDKIYFPITRKDETRLNEIYKFLCYVSKPGTDILFITRPTFDLVVSSKFKIISKEQVMRGKSEYSVVVIKKI